MEDSDPEGSSFLGSGPERIEIHPGSDPQERFEGSILTSLAVEDFMQCAAG